jgi:hypothetical protein
MTKPFTILAVAIFGLVAVIHVLRLIFAWDVTISGLVVPMWVSIAGAILGGVLAVMVKKEARL